MSSMRVEIALQTKYTCCISLCNDRINVFMKTNFWVKYQTGFVATNLNNWYAGDTVHLGNNNHTKSEVNVKSLCMEIPLCMWIIYYSFFLFKNGPTPFHTNNTIFTTNQCEKMSKYPSSIWHWDSNPRPFKHESSPITYRPRLPPIILQLSRLVLTLLQLSGQLVRHLLDRRRIHSGRWRRPLLLHQSNQAHPLVRHVGKFPLLLRVQVQARGLPHPRLTSARDRFVLGQTLNTSSPHQCDHIGRFF